MIRLFFALLFIFSGNVFALEPLNSMNCTIKGVYEVNTKGDLDKVSRTKGSMIASFLEMIGERKTSGFYGDAEGSEFSVNRKTGVYVGRFVKNEEWKKYVLDYGSKDQAFKILSTSTGGYMHAQYLQIDIFVDGVIKPFRLVDGGTVFSGVCS